MPARVQQLIMGLGKGKQTNISTAGTTFIRMKKLDTTLTTPKPVFENDAAEIGKGNEFISQTFPSNYDVANRIEKYASAEFVTWACAFALGNATVTGSNAPYTYTIVPIDPGTTLELPYFSLVEQVSEGGGNAVDNLYVGCAIEDFTYQFAYGPGRASSRVTVNWVGSGLVTSPSGITVPAVTTENNMLAASMSLSVNGVDYVSTKRILSGTLGWKNNLLLNAGFFPGSGMQNGLQVRGRMEIGARVPSFQFTARLLAGSTEYNTLVNQTTGTATLSVNHDAGNSVSFTFPQMAFQVVENAEADGIVAVSPENEAKRLAKQLYSINIDSSMAKQIVNLAQQKYAGHVSIAVRDPDVRKMLMLYSQSTGQKMPLSASTPQSASLAEVGGRLYQQATYVNGTPYTFQSNLPVLGGYQTGTYPTPGPMSLQLNVSGQGAAQFVAGQVVTPEFVQAQWSSAGAASNGRLQNSAMIQQPGLVIS